MQEPLLHTAAIFVSAAACTLALSRVSPIENHILLAIPLLNEPSPNLVAYNEEVLIDVQYGMILGKSQIDCATDVYRIS
jgi:hypothetical protein